MTRRCRMAARTDNNQKRSRPEGGHGPSISDATAKLARTIGRQVSAYSGSNTLSVAFRGRKRVNAQSSACEQKARPDSQVLYTNAKLTRISDFDVTSCQDSINWAAIFQARVSNCL